MRAWRAVSLVLALAATAHAQGAANVQLGKARLGYLDELDPGWLPVSVPLENLGAEGSVRLVATVHGKRGDRWTSEKTVALPARSRRVETLYVHVDEAATGIELEVSAAGRRLADVSRGVSWRGSGWRNAPGEVSVPLHALAVREGPSDDRLASWLEPPPAVANAPPPVVLSAATIEPRELPDRPQGFDGIDVVVLSRTGARDLDEARRRALLAWLRAGGRVVLLPGSDPGWFRDDLVKSLLPADAEVSVVRASLAGLVKVTSTPPSSAAHDVPLFAVSSARHGIRIGPEVVDGKRVPYFTVFKYGAGDVVLCACDFDAAPFDRWPRGRRELGRMLHAALEPVPERGRVADDGRLAPWFEQALAEGELPSPLLLIPLVLLYLACIGPLNHRFVRRASTPVVSVLTVPAVSLVFTLVCFVAGYVLRGSSTTTDRLAVIEARPGEDLAREWAGLRIRSASSTKYTVSAAENLVVTQRSWREASPDEDRSRVELTRTIQDGDRFAFPELPLNLWERAFFQARGPFPLGGAVTVLVAPGVVTITNRTRFALGPGVVFLPGTEGFRVPPLAPAETTRLDGTKRSSVKADHAEVLAVIARDEAQAKAGARGLDTFLGQLRLETTYVARILDAPSSIEVRGAAPDRDLAVLIVQGDDQARDEESLRWATNVTQQRWREDYDDAIAVLSAIPPTSRCHARAQTVRAFIATAKYVDGAQDAYDSGDIEGAKKRVLDVLALPDLDQESVHEIRSRLGAWTAVAKAFEEAARSEENLTLALKKWTAVVAKESSKENRFRKEAAARVEALEEISVLTTPDAVDRANTALVEGRPWEAALAFRHAIRRRTAAVDLGEIRKAVADMETSRRLLASVRATPRPLFQRALDFEILSLLRQFLPPDDPRAAAAERLESELEAEAGQ